jgi:outer membrane receptor protein involved in Fe transport
MRWQAADWLALRGNYGSSFQAPSLRQTSPSTSSAFVNDTCTAGAPTANIGVTTVGDGDLEPQTADNTSFGFILQPLESLTVSIDYWVYDYKNLISGGESPQSIVNADCADGISDDPRVSRHAGTGQIDGVTVSARNIGAVKTSGFDLRFAYAMDLQRLGSLNFSAEATNIHQFDAQATPDSPVIDAAGSRNSANDASDFGPTPELRANARIGWMIGNQSVDAIVRFIDSYEEDASGGVVDSFTTLDLQYGLSTALFGDETRFALGINNLFDEDPPSIGLRNRPGFDAFVHSPIGREVYVRLTQSF